jgi:flavin-binding protein dodecin
MPAAEIAAAVTGFRASLEIVKAMIGLRDEEAFRAKSIELLGTVADSLEKAIEAREAYAEQADKIRALEAKIAKLESARVERAKYELRTLEPGRKGVSDSSGL